MKFSFAVGCFFAGTFSTTRHGLSMIAELFEVFDEFDWFLAFLSFWNGFSLFAKWFEVFCKFELYKIHFYNWKLSIGLKSQKESKLFKAKVH